MWAAVLRLCVAIDSMQRCSIDSIMIEQSSFLLHKYDHYVSLSIVADVIPRELCPVLLKLV